jgi:hypothetical protein
MSPLGLAIQAGELAGVTLPDTLEAGKKRILPQHASAGR